MSRSSLSRFPADCRAVAEHFPHADGCAHCVKKVFLKSDVESHSRYKAELSLGSIKLRRFRRLFAAAQSTELSKLPNPLTNIRFFGCGMRGPVDPPARSRFAGDDHRNYDERLRHRPVVCDAEVNARLIALRRQDLKPGQRPDAQVHGRTA